MAEVRLPAVLDPVTARDEVREQRRLRSTPPARRKPEMRREPAMRKAAATARNQGFSGRPGARILIGDDFWRFFLSPFLFSLGIGLVSEGGRVWEEREIYYRERESIPCLYVQSV